MKPHPDGPYLMAALICEKVLQEPDGITTLVRVVDRVQVAATSTLPGVALPENMPPIAVNTLTLFIGFKSGAARGTHKVGVRLEKPDGLKILTQEVDMLFEGEDRGVNLKMPLNLVLDMPGLYWFEVLLDGEFVTRVPLRIVYQRQGLTQ